MSAPDFGYAPPIPRLFTYGDPRQLQPQRRVYPLEVGLTRDHVPELLRLVGDEQFDFLDSDDPAVWGPLHAWRALGQIKDPVVIEPLLDYNVIAHAVDDDWFIEDLPGLIAGFGPIAIAPVAARLGDRQLDLYVRVSCGSTLSKLGEKHANARGQCLQILAAQLAQGESEDPDLNGFIVSDLVDLKAVEAAETIEKAFAAGWVSPMVVGDWPEVRRLLGLPAPPPPAKRQSKKPVDFKSLRKGAKSRKRQR